MNKRNVGWEEKGKPIETEESEEMEEEETGKRSPQEEPPGTWLQRRRVKG